MALLFIDGFDTYATTNDAPVTDAIHTAGYVTSDGFGGPANTQVLTDTRTGIGFSLSPVNSNEGGWIARFFPTAAGIVTGFAIKWQADQAGAICSLLYNNGVGGAYTQLTLSWNGMNGISCYTGDDVGVYQSPPNVLFDGVWQYVEVKYSPGIATSYLEVRVDGVAVITVTNETLQHAGAAALINEFQFNGPGSGWYYCDDWYLCDLSGTSFNDFLGDCVVHSLLPNSDAGTNQMTQAGGASGEHFSDVNDVPADGDTSYLNSNTSGQKELFGLSAIPNDIITVLAISVNVTARKTAPGLGTYKICLVYGENELDSPLKSAPIDYIQTQFLCPAPPGGGNWTNAALTASKIGFFIP